jgi:hypothetical protein
MGRSKWRKRQRPVAPKSTATSNPTVTVQSVTPVCPGAERLGLDGIVYAALAEVESLVKDMREGIDVPNGIWDEETAVRRYLIYLSLLTNIVLADMGMSAVHSNDYAVLMKARILVEYANKAIYCNNNPQYALFFTTICEAESVLKKLRKGGADEDTIAAAEKELQDRKQRFPTVVGMNEVKLGQMMREHTRDGDPKRNDEYIWLYGAPSALLHGDPEGIRTIMPVDDQGHTHLSTSVDDGYLNALMVDAGSNVLIFCDTFIQRFKPEDETLLARLSKLSIAFKTLSLEHAVGRTEESLVILGEELDAELAMTAGARKL